MAYPLTDEERVEVTLLFHGNIAETAWCEAQYADEVGRSMVDAYAAFGPCTYTVRPMTLAPIVPLSPRPKNRKFDLSKYETETQPSLSIGTGQNIAPIELDFGSASATGYSAWDTKKPHQRRAPQKVGKRGRRPRPTGKIIHHFEIVN